MTKEEALLLLVKYKEGNCTDNEKKLIEKWLFQYDSDSPPLSAEEINQIGEDIWLTLPQSPQSIYRKFSFWSRIAAAAALIVAAGFSFFYLHQTAKLNRQVAVHKVATDVLPGGNKAYLTLADGSRISLTEAANGKIASQAGVSITKRADGQLIYTVMAPAGELDNTRLNTITTPNGGQWQIRLPDGSLVWLNAASSLSYPITFKALSTRSVELKGEAYFEVAKDSLHPFVVKSSGQQIQVLGTHFNVNSYNDEAGIRTTLLEGKVKINNSILKPGEQAFLKGDRLQITGVDTSLVVAWKNGLFKFNGTPLRELMRQVSRWYDVDVAFEGNSGDRKFYGEIERSYSLLEVLNVLQYSKIHFHLQSAEKVEGRKLLTITP